MSYLNQHELLQTQDTWKRSQIRLPPSLHQAVVDYANDNNMSLNTAIVELLNNGLITSPTDQSDIPKKILNEIQAIKNATGNYIFTEWRYTESYNPNERLQHNEKARLAGSKFLTSFFKDNPTYQLISIENITSLDHKGREVLDGLRIWYIY